MSTERKRPMRKPTAREKQDEVDRRTDLVYAALEKDVTTRREICLATGLSFFNLAELLRNDKKLFASYCVRRKMLVDMAADNIQDIIKDPTHPQHFAASKYVLAKYKSDLDEVLESADQSEIAVELSSLGNSKNPVRITFSSNKNNKEDQEDID